MAGTRPYEIPVIIEPVCGFEGDKKLVLSVSYDEMPHKKYNPSAEELNEAGKRTFEVNTLAIRRTLKSLDNLTNF